MDSQRVSARKLFAAGKYAAAEKLYLKILRKSRDDPEALQLLGTIAYRQNRMERAETYFRKSLSISPENHELHFQLGCVSDRRGDHETAVRCFERALSLKPDFAEPHLALGNLLARLGRLAESKMHYTAVLLQAPDHVVARNNLANVLASQGDIVHALPEWRKVIDSCPGYHAAWSNYLLALNYLPESSCSDLFEQHRLWGEAISRTVNACRNHANTREQDRVVRVGYVSADFRQHSVSYFMEPVLESHDRENFSIYCYSGVTLPDSTTHRLLGFADEVRDIANTDDDAVASLIRDDRIDILVDLSGHTDGNRLPLFARKPAPVQITYLGYPNTTGLRAMDYRLTDAIADPGDADQVFYTEALVRLEGGFLCYRPPREAPDVSDLPADGAGCITFGVFNNVAKLNADSVELWAAILKRVEGSRLLFKNRAFSDEQTCSRFMALLEAQGIAAGRVQFSGLTVNKPGYLETYNRVDIALDSCPYNGTTTTFDALWMGVPVVTLCGDRHAGRVGASILSRTGQADLVARDRQHYVEIAVSLAMDTARLRRTRAGLRQVLAASTLCDARRMCCVLEQVYRELWSDWCLRGA